MELEEKYGSEIVALENQYYSLYTNQERKAFEAQNPQFKKYLAEKKQKNKEIDERMNAMSFYLPEAPELRGNEALSETQQAIEATPQSLPPEYLQQLLGDALFESVASSLMEGRNPSYYAQRELQYIAEGMGMTADELLAYIRTSLQQ